MKISPSRRGFILAVLAGICLLPSVSNAAVTIVGTGPDSSFLVLESPGLGSLTYEVHYTFGAGNYDAKFLLDQVVAGGVGITANYFNFGSPSAPNYFVDSINGEAGTSSPPFLYWAQWVSGGLGYQNDDFTFNPGGVPRGNWTIGYGVSTHTIQPGSWDALVYSDGSVMPSVAPVPEASSALLGAAGGLVIFRRRRRSA